MTAANPPTSPFSCPHCGAKYKVVAIEAATASPTEPGVGCLSCGGQLAAREGDFLLKYFLVGNTGKRRRPDQ